MIKLSLFACLLASNAFATSFAPVPFEKQLREADGVIEGRFISASTIKISNDQVLTQAQFKVLSSAGFAQGEMLNKQNFTIVYPGGNWQGITYSVPGVPKFSSDEDVFLVISRGPNGFTLNNLGLSKYKVITDGTEKALVSEIFPNDPELGNISFSKVEKAVANVFGKHIVSVSEEADIVAKGEIKKLENVKRDIASTKDEPKGESHAGSTGFWLGILFGVLGIFSLWYSRQRQ